MSRNEKLIIDAKNLIEAGKFDSVSNEVFKLLNDNLKDDEKRSCNVLEAEEKKSLADENCIKIQTEDLLTQYLPLYDAMHEVGLSPDHKQAERFLAELGSQGLFVFRMPKEIMDEMIKQTTEGGIIEGNNEKPAM